MDRYNYWESLMEGERQRGSTILRNRLGNNMCFHLGKKFVGKNNLKEYSKPFKKRELDTSKLQNNLYRCCGNKRQRGCEPTRQ